MDFIEGFPNSFGKKVIFVVVDGLSKAAHFMALPHPYTASDVAQSYLGMCLSCMGSQILSRVIEMPYSSTSFGKTS